MPASDEDKDRIQAAREAAWNLGGWRLTVDDAVNIKPLTHMAIVFPDVGGGVSMGRFLCYSTSAADAAEAGLEVLRGIVERDEPWPESG